MIFYSLIAVVILSPLPFATARPWSCYLWVCLVSLLSIAWGVEHLHKKSNNLAKITDVTLIFILVIGWLLFQATWSVSIELTHPLWGLAAEIINPAQRHLISLTPADSVTSILGLLSYGMVFLLAFSYSVHQDKARQVFFSIMMSGICYCLYGLIVYLGNFHTILWFDKWAYQGDLTSTFVSRNHFASYAGLTLLCALGLLVKEVNAALKHNIGGNIGLQRFFEQLIIQSWLPLFAFIIIATALTLTHSRGGIFSTLIAVSILLLSLNLNSYSRNKYILIITTLFIVIGATVFYISSAGLVARLDAIGFSDPAREMVRELTWNASMTNPWLGFGYGSFEEVFPLYKNLEIAGSVNNPSLWDYAHNSYLELIFEIGLPAAIAVFYCFFRLAYISFKGLLIRKRNWIYPMIGLSATCLIAIHALVDFSLQIPAVTYTYMLLMGAACAQAFSTHSK